MLPALPHMHSSTGGYRRGRYRSVFIWGATRKLSVRSSAPFFAPRESSFDDMRPEKYTIFSDSMAAIERLRKDRPGPGQAIAKAIIDFEEAMRERRCSPTIRWTHTKGLRATRSPTRTPSGRRTVTQARWTRAVSERPALPVSHEMRQRPRHEARWDMSKPNDDTGPP